MRRLSFITLFVIFHSLICSGQSFKKHKPQKSRFIPDKFNQKQTINDIISYGIVEGPLVGDAGIKSEQYNRFVTLKFNLLDSQLVLLTKHLNSVVKAYAFWALVQKNYSGIKQLIEKHLNDKQTFRYQGEGRIETYYINEWFLELGKQFITEKEFSSYEKAIYNFVAY